MKIQSKFHGEIEFLEQDIMIFNQGVLGFEDEKQYVLLDLMPESGSLFKVLQSISSPSVAFITTDPFAFESSYEFELKEKDINDLSIESEKDLLVLSIMTLPKEGAHTTINLIAPIIINQLNNEGMQVVLDGNTYTTKHLIKLKGESTC